MTSESACSHHVPARRSDGRWASRSAPRQVFEASGDTLFNDIESHFQFETIYPTNWSVKLLLLLVPRVFQQPGRRRSMHSGSRSTTTGSCMPVASGRRRNLFVRITHQRTTAPHGMLGRSSAQGTMRRLGGAAGTDPAPDARVRSILATAGGESIRVRSTGQCPRRTMSVAAFSQARRRHRGAAAFPPVHESTTPRREDRRCEGWEAAAPGPVLRHSRGRC